MEVLVCLFGAFALPTLCFAAFHARNKGCGLALGCAGFVLNAVLSVWYAAVLVPEIRREGAEIFWVFGAPAIALSLCFAALAVAAVTANTLKLRAEYGEAKEAVKC